MKTVLVIFTTLLFLVCTAFSPKLSHAQQLVENGGFETGNLNGWTQESSAGFAGEWLAYTGTLVGGDLVLFPPVGTFAAIVDQGDPDANILYQDISIPEGASVECSLIYYYENMADDENGMAIVNNTFTTNSQLSHDNSDSQATAQRLFINGNGLSLATPNQQFRIDVMDPAAPSFDTGAGVLLPLFQTQPGDPNSLSYTNLNFDLSSFAGSTVRIRAAVAVTLAPLLGAIDEVSCVVGDVVTVATVPAISEWGILALACLLGIASYIGLRRKSVST